MEVLFTLVTLSVELKLESGFRLEVFKCEVPLLHLVFVRDGLPYSIGGGAIGLLNNDGLMSLKFREGLQKIFTVFFAQCLICRIVLFGAKFIGSLIAIKHEFQPVEQRMESCGGADDVSGCDLAVKEHKPAGLLSFRIQFPPDDLTLPVEFKNLPGLDDDYLRG